jgi:hypothetical protein
METMQMSEEKRDNPLFGGLVFSLAQGAMAQLGKIANPATGKIEKDLAGAGQTIDLLDMLAEKTAGNLTEGEEKMLKRVVGDLKLNYWETQKDEAAAAQNAQQEKAPDGKGE